MTKKIEKEFIDAFGNPYTEEILTREEVEKILSELDMAEIIREAWNQHIDSYGRTVVSLDLRTGEVVYANYTAGSGSIQSAHYIQIYFIAQNTLANDAWEWNGDILSEEEYEQILKENETEESIDMYEAVKKAGIDFDERFADYLIWCYFEGGGLEEWRYEIEMQLKEIYENDC